jgi:hypothetical protein
MRRQLAWLLVSVLLLEACASGAPPPPATSTDAMGLAAVHHALEDQPATIELASGEIVRDAEGMVMTPESTSWRGDGDRERTVPTTQICKVTRQIRKRAGKGFAWGLLAGAPVAVVSANSSRDPLARLTLFLFTEALCGFLGMFVGAGLKKPPDRVVYTAAGSCRTAR